MLKSPSCSGRAAHSGLNYNYFMNDKDLDSSSLLTQRPNVEGATRADRPSSISPYPANVTVKGDNVFKDGKYLGYVDRVQNWGTDFLARPEDARRPNQFFNTKTRAVNYLIQ